MLHRVVLIALSVAAANASRAADAIVVCGDDLRESIQPWVDYRSEQGWGIHVIRSRPLANELASDIRAYARAMPKQPSAIVLIGDCQIRHARGPVDAARAVPTHHLPSPISASLGSPPLLASDILFGDLDGDGIADVPVGRLPIDEPEQVKPFLDRIRCYEASEQYGRWRHRVDLTAGVGGFGVLVDAAIESVARGIITSKLPTGIQTHVTYASPTSPFFPGFSNFSDTVVDQFNTGGLFWVYAGHGQIAELDRVPAVASGRPILDPTSVTRLNRPAARAPIALLLACYTGAFDASNDCLAERMLMQPGGPIAVVAGSRMTLPYGNATIATSMIDSWFVDRPATLGEAWFRTTSKAARDPANTTHTSPTMIDAMAAMLSPTADRLPQERTEHTRLYNLLGDPLLRLKHPETVTIQCPIDSAPGRTIQVCGRSPLAGKMTIELHRRGQPSLEVLQDLRASDRHRACCETMLSSHQYEVLGDEFKVDLELPASVRQSILVVARVESNDRYALGTDRVLIRKPKQTQTVSEVTQTVPAKKTN